MGTIGGASDLYDLWVAYQQVSKGHCVNVLILGVDKLATGNDGRDSAVESLAQVVHPQFETLYSPPIIPIFTLAACKHMNTYGITEEEL